MCATAHELNNFQSSNFVQLFNFKESKCRVCFYRVRSEQYRRIFSVIPSINVHSFANGKIIIIVDAPAVPEREKQPRGPAKTMLTMGYPLSDICKIAGLIQAEVKAIK